MIPNRTSPVGEVPMPVGYVFLSPTMRCNLRCAQCNIEALDEKRVDLAADQIERTFRDSRVLEKRSILISGGEPFVRRDLARIVEFLANRDHHVSIFTNGSYPERVKELLARPGLNKKVWITVSIDGPPEVQAEIRGVKNLYDKCVETLRVAKEAGARPHVNTVVLRENIPHLAQMKRTFDEMGVPVLFTPLLTFKGAERWYDEDPGYTSDEVSTILPYLNSVTTDPAYVLSGRKIMIRNCHAGSSSCYIDNLGRVHACAIGPDYAGYSGLTLGNLHDFDFDFDRLWISEGAEKVRARVAKCPGCYNACEVSREVNCHEFQIDPDFEQVRSMISLPSDLEPHGTGSSVFLAGGWTGSGGYYRAFKGSGTVFMNVPSEGTRLEVTVVGLYGEMKGGDYELDARVGGSSLGTFQVSTHFNGGPQIAVFPVAPEYRGDDVPIKLTLRNPSWSESDSKKETLGLAVSQIRFQ